jgi:hypothetical protein
MDSLGAFADTVLSQEGRKRCHCLRSAHGLEGFFDHRFAGRAKAKGFRGYAMPKLPLHAAASASKGLGCSQSWWHRQRRNGYIGLRLTSRQPCQGFLPLARRALA